MGAWRSIAADTVTIISYIIVPNEVLGPNIHGPKHLWAQTSLGPNLYGPKPPWPQTYLGPKGNGPKRQWAQTSMGQSEIVQSEILAQMRLAKRRFRPIADWPK